MSKRREYVKINYDPGFNFGNCALRAIARAVYQDEYNEYFNLMIKSLTKMEHVTDGLSFYEIKKILNFLVKQKQITIAYYPNTYKVSYLDLVASNPDRDILAHFDGHLSCARKGEIMDGYYNQEELRKNKPTGWWFITKVEPKPNIEWRDMTSITRSGTSLGAAGVGSSIIFDYNQWLDRVQNAYRDNCNNK